MKLFRNCRLIYVLFYLKEEVLVDQQFENLQDQIFLLKGLVETQNAEHELRIRKAEEEIDKLSWEVKLLKNGQLQGGSNPTRRARSAATDDDLFKTITFPDDNESLSELKMATSTVYPTQKSILLG